jgi:hypothetical protein
MPSKEENVTKKPSSVKKMAFDVFPSTLLRDREIKL